MAHLGQVSEGTTPQILKMILTNSDPRSYCRICLFQKQSRVHLDIVRMSVEGLEGLGNVWVRIDILKCFERVEAERYTELVERGYLPVPSLHDSQDLDRPEDIWDAVGPEATCSGQVRSVQRKE